jgi:ankyrin repeat protein
MYYEAIKELNSDSARNYLKFGLYRKYLTENYWTKVSALQIINDEIFIVRYINCTDKGGTTLLEYLCCKQNLPNRTDLIRKLLTNGAKSGQALSNYCYYPDSSKEHPILRMLVEYGADVNGKVNNIKIPLIFLVKDDVSVVKVLIELGADVFVKDSNNRDIVQYSRYHGHLNVAKYLEDYISTLKKDN